MAVPLRSLVPSILSFALPLCLRLFHLSLQPHTLFLLVGMFALISEQGYRETLETLSPELSEHTGPFSHIGVCLLAQIFVQDLGGWRGELLFWIIFARWAFGLCSTHRLRINVCCFFVCLYGGGGLISMESFREAYDFRYRPTKTRTHAFLVATVMTPIFAPDVLAPGHTNRGKTWAQIVIIWLHFYHCVGYMVALASYL